MRVVMALDQGTTSSRAILFDQGGIVLAVAQREFTQHYPRPGWVEHDAREIWQTQLEVAHEALDQCDLSAENVAAIGIANQRETTLIWDRQTGEPVYNAIVWQDRRTADFCDALIDAGHSDLVQKKSGLLIDSYFCASKIHWILENVAGIRERAESGQLAFGTIDSWVLWNLTDGRVHGTDVTNASRTMLFNIASSDWDDELLSLFKIPRSLLPQVYPSCHLFGSSDAELFGFSIPIAGLAGDQQAALFGQNCNRAGMAKNTYGTGCFMLMNVGDKTMESHSNLLTTMTCSPTGQKEYALEGSVFIAGAAVQWLRDGLGMIESASEIESLAASVPDSDGVYVVPAFAGLGAPHWDAQARGTLLGITRGTTRGHLARATLEGIAHQVADVLDAMKQDAGKPITELRVDGGMSGNNLLMQFQADILGIPVVRPKIVETTALGAAFLAGLAVGFWASIEEVIEIWQTDQVFQPAMPNDEVEQRRERWRDALERSRNWASGDA